MRVKLRSWIIRGTLLLALVSVARMAPVWPVYRAYLASRSSGAVLFSIVQAVGMRGADTAAPRQDRGQLFCRSGSHR